MLGGAVEQFGSGHFTGFTQGAVESPKSAGRGDASGRQELDVDPADAQAPKLLLLNGEKHFVFSGCDGLRQGGEKAEDFDAILHAAQRELAADTGMHDDHALLRKSF